MKVMKFGGTSVGKPERMHQVANLITKDEGKRIVVLSALSGTTNALIDLSESLSVNERGIAKTKIDSLHDFYRQFAERLVKSEQGRQKAAEIIEEHFDFFNIILKINYSEALNKDILAQGELMSSKLFSAYLDEAGIEHVLLPALDFMQIDHFEEPLIGNIKVKLTQLINNHEDCDLFITQGYICRNHRGEVDNLKRGGSDYTASIIGAATGATVCEIWTDINGMHNNDPRVVEKSIPVNQLSFEEAAELAYFGAKILHPASIWPARHYNVPVKLLNTMDPAAEGTSITADAGSVGAKAVAAKDDIIAIKIKSSRMLLAYGFLRKIFEVFEYYRTPIDMVTTSEVAVSVTIDRRDRLDEISKELEAFGVVEIDDDQSIVAVVGNEIAETPKVMSRLFSAISDIPVRMISYGGSRHNISLVVPSQYKEKTLQCLNNGLFDL